MPPRRKKMRMTLKSDSKKPSSQPLLKFPLLVQIEIIKFLTPSEQFLLSKCSKRTHRVVKKSIPKKRDPEIWVHPNDLKTNFFYLKLADNKFLIHKSSKPPPEQKKIHEYICDLFGARSELYVNWGDSGLRPEMFLSLKINEFDQNSIRRSNFFNTSWLGSVVRKYSERYSNQDLVLYEGRDANYLSTDNTFSCAKNLMLSSSRGFCPANILLPFQGEHLLMEDVAITTFFIQVFVENWKKKRNDRLKSVILQLQRESVISGLKYEKFSGSDKRFQYDSPIKEYHNLPRGLFDCTDGWEIRRETDGKVATIHTTKDYFLFLVW